MTMIVLDIVHLEARINQRLRAEPLPDGELPADLNCLAELYAWMILLRQRAVELECLPKRLREVALAHVLAPGSELVREHGNSRPAVAGGMVDGGDGGVPDAPAPGAAELP
jgi:hypothetical protein